MSKTILQSYLETPRQVYTIASGDAGIIQTVQLMQQIIEESSKNQYVRRWAEEMVRGVANNDKMGEVDAVFNFVKDNVRYTKDMLSSEYLQTPFYLLQRMETEGTVFGDCDDMTMLILSALKALGFEVMIKIAAYQQQSDYSHVYGLVNIEGQWTAVDAIVDDFIVGSEAPNATRTQLFGA